MGVLPACLYRHHMLVWCLQKSEEGAETGELELTDRREAVTMQLLEPEPGSSEKAVSALNLRAITLAPPS